MSIIIIIDIIVILLISNFVKIKNIPAGRKIINVGITIHPKYIVVFDIPFCRKFMEDELFSSIDF
tara:strand:+ start:312 stop:506 length:195 start_codon:yes stop_codon:yes gene_type:complete